MPPGLANGSFKGAVLKARLQVGELAGEGSLLSLLRGATFVRQQLREQTEEWGKWVPEKGRNHSIQVFVDTGTTLDSNLAVT